MGTAFSTGRGATAPPGFVVYDLYANGGGQDGCGTGTPSFEQSHFLPGRDCSWDE